MTETPTTPEPSDDELAAIWKRTPWGTNAYRAIYDAGFAAGRTQALEEAARIAEKAWDEGFAAADINRPRSRQGHWDNTRHGIRTWVPDPLPVNPYRAAAIRTGTTTEDHK